MTPRARPAYCFVPLPFHMHPSPADAPAPPFLMKSGAMTVRQSAVGRLGPEVTQDGDSGYK